ncbi:hypothetical protein LBW62_25540 [Ralstonia solanacearum]|uniref:hypothetical protein n=1 Tax=Ralstonia solanacearum TaxID=305 RepID=UPI0005C5174E|nr:hypothetical protein [Ralstonia solanacearum]MDB0544604.1 hypothetical protein [Ralstonia solanacearum]MDB0554407.1 hypothetical protein [Ralstonia solanacearum]MDB0559526.1 hypothetical protein [Ralstonia solanacearum]
MKLEFSWDGLAGSDLSPYCSSDVVGKAGLDFLACLLMDGGGQRHICMIPWIDEGIARVHAVIKGEASAANWSRDAWGAKISLDGVEVYSLYDEGYSEVLTVTMFLHALLAWREFIKSTPQIGIVQAVVI